MTRREIGLREGYSLARRAGLWYFTAAFVAFVWVLRGDTIEADHGIKEQS